MILQIDKIVEICCGLLQYTLRKPLSQIGRHGEYIWLSTDPSSADIGCAACRRKQVQTDKSRDHPDTIKRRVLAVSTVTLGAPAMLYLFGRQSEEGQLFSQPLLKHIGVSALPASGGILGISCGALHSPISLSTLFLSLTYTLHPWY